MRVGSLRELWDKEYADVGRYGMIASAFGLMGLLLMPFGSGDGSRELMFTVASNACAIVMWS